MSGKVVDLDPQKRLTKEAFERIKATITGFQPEDLDSFVLLYTDKEGGVNFEAFGVDWALLGISQAYIEDLRSQLLYGNEDSDEEC